MNRRIYVCVGGIHSVNVERLSPMVTHAMFKCRLPLETECEMLKIVKIKT